MRCPRALALSSALVLGATAAVSGGPGPSTPGEVRGLWVARSSLTSPEAIDAMVRAAADAGLNTLLVQVRGRGEAFYRSDLEPRATELAGQPAAFDPLAHVLDRAHAAGLQVHAWVNVNLVSSATTLPRSREHVVYRHPEWLMVPRDLADRLQSLDPQSPAYLDTLARWTRANDTRVEGLFLSPLVAAARDYTVRVARELVDRYPLDGLHLDYIRYPGPAFDYGAEAMSAFRAARLPHASPADAARYDERAVDDAAAWPDILPASWDEFRRDRLTELVARIAVEARHRRPNLVVTAAVVPDLHEAGQRMQDWPRWATDGYLDAVCPMAYTPDADQFVRQVETLRASADGTPLWVGIGAYRLPAARAAGHVRHARRSGADGILLFSYDGVSRQAASAAAYLASLRTVLLDLPDPAGAGG